MKNFKFLALLGVIALAGSMSFTSCSSDDDLGNTPSAKLTGDDVPVNLVLNVATNNSASTRMTASSVQADLNQSFRGIDNATLMAYKMSSDGNHVKEATSAEKVYGFGQIMAAGYLTSSDNENSSSNRILELSLPTATNTLLFYGKAIKSGSDDTEGKIEYKVDEDGDISNNSFKLVSRLHDEDGFNNAQALIAAVFTYLNTAGLNDATVQWDHNTQGDTSDDITVEHVTIHWNQFAKIDDGKLVVNDKAPLDATGATPMCPLGEILGGAYVALNTVYTGEIRAGSGAATGRMLIDLNDILDKVSTATPVSIQEKVAQNFAQSIRSILTSIINPNNPTTPWAATATVANAIGYTNDVSGVSNLNNFPTAYGLPMGAAQLTNTQADANSTIYTWSYVDDLPMSGMGGGTTNVANYMYPAELTYFGNSPIRVSDIAHETNDYPNGTTNWEGTWTADWSQTFGHVISTTRSVAMKENINYGTALLKTTVRYGAPYLHDNNNAIQAARNESVEDDAIIVANGTTSPFTLTGVVVGGQEAEMGWNYVAKASEPKFSQMVYDGAIASAAIPLYDESGGAKSSPNYTMVWDNYDPKLSVNEQSAVYIALEFRNETGVDFWGKDNIIRNGGTFYIIGKLDPQTNAGDIEWPDAYKQSLPPYDTDGSTIQAKRVFIQDYVTEANFVIGENSLQSAYVTVPDLRSSQISLGLSVDLKWRNGLTFDVTLGEN